MIGVGIATYNREKQFERIVNSIDTVDCVDCVVCIKDGGHPPYKFEPKCEYIQIEENRGIGICKNILIDRLLEKGCEHIFILEDDCLVTNNNIWEYCISFSEESGLLHFNWNDYRYPAHTRVMFAKHTGVVSTNTEANFSYFHKKFLENIRFDPAYKNAWEHIDLELQGEKLGFLPPFRSFISPDKMEKYLQLIDDDQSTITGIGEYNRNVMDGHYHFIQKWGKSVNQMTSPVNDETLYQRMKEITIKHARR